MLGRSMTLPLWFMILFSIEHRHILACVHGTAWRRQMYSCHSNSLSPLSVQTCGWTLGLMNWRTPPCRHIIPLFRNTTIVASLLGQPCTRDINILGADVHGSTYVGWSLTWFWHRVATREPSCRNQSREVPPAPKDSCLPYCKHKEATWSTGLHE